MDGDGLWHCYTNIRAGPAATWHQVTHWSSSLTLRCSSNCSRLSPNPGNCGTPLTEEDGKRVMVSYQNIHIGTYIYIYIYVYIYMCVYLYIIYIYICVCVFKCIYIYQNRFIDWFAMLYVYLYIMYIYIYACMYLTNTVVPSGFLQHSEISSG